MKTTWILAIGIVAMMAISMSAFADSWIISKETKEVKDFKELKENPIKVQHNLAKIKKIHKKKPINANHLPYGALVR